MLLVVVDRDYSPEPYTLEFRKVGGRWWVACRTSGGDVLGGETFDRDIVDAMDGLTGDVRWIHDALISRPLVADGTRSKGEGGPINVSPR